VSILYRDFHFDSYSYQIKYNSPGLKKKNGTCNLIYYREVVFYWDKIRVGTLYANNAHNIPLYLRIYVVGLIINHALFLE